MSGSKITKQQVKRYMDFRKKHTQAVSAAKAGISERSARRIEHNQLQPKSSQPRHWRTRDDPLQAVWDSIVLPWIREDNEITPVGIFDYLCEHHQDIFRPSARRTLERRIANWRSVHGSPKDVIFLQTHGYGELGIADFTYINLGVRIADDPLKHLLFHYRLPASGWAYAQVVYGGESFTALSDGLQNAFQASNGVPLDVRTDSLSAAYKNMSSREDFTERYHEFANHYGFKPTRNNRGVAHENGAIESAHRHIKAQITQALKLRGSSNFNCRAEYQAFIQNLIDRRNQRVHDKFALEQRQLQALPAYPSDNYSEHYVSVSRTSTISLKRVTYTVPSRLIGNRLLARVYDQRIALYLGMEQVLELERLYTRNKTGRARSVNYRHIIDALNKKPLAFRHSKLRDDILPNDNYKSIWHYVDDSLSADEACYYIVKLLYLAHRHDCEHSLETYVLEGIRQRQLPTIRQCEERFIRIIAMPPSIAIKQHSLQDYSQLFGAHHA